MEIINSKYPSANTSYSRHVDRAGFWDLQVYESSACSIHICMSHWVFSWLF